MLRNMVQSCLFRVYPCFTDYVILSKRLLSMKIFEGENENMVFVYKVVKQKSSGMRYIGGYIIILIVFVLFASVLSKLSISHEHNNSGLVLPLATVLLLIIYFLTKRHRERAFDFEDMGRITFTKDKVYLDNGATMSFNYSQ